MQRIWGWSHLEKCFFFTKWAHQQRTCMYERSRIVRDISLIFYEFRVALCDFCTFSLGFLKTGLAKISTHSVTWDRALFSFHFENYIPAGKEKRKESLIQNVYETSSAHFLIDWHLPNQTTKITSVTCFFSMQIFHTREKCRLTALKNSFYLLIFSRKNKTVSTITFNFLRD